MLCGGWSKFRALEPEDAKLFKEIVTLQGVEYEPFAVATQLVAGTNCKFLCNATSVTRPPRDFLAVVTIFVPLEKTEPAVITHIAELNA